MIDDMVQKSAATRLLASFAPKTSIDAKVARLIDRLVSTDPKQVQAAVTALTMLGPAAVPSIIRRIDDRRDMPAGGVAFENKFPNAFESVAHYGAAKVVDCLNLVLNRLTGESHGFLDISMDFDFKDQRAANAARDETVRGWRRHLARTPSALRPPSKSLPPAVPPKTRAAKLVNSPTSSSLDRRAGWTRPESGPARNSSW